MCGHMCCCTTGNVEGPDVPPYVLLYNWQCGGARCAAIYVLLHTGHVLGQILKTTNGFLILWRSNSQRLVLQSVAYLGMYT